MKIKTIQDVIDALHDTDFRREWWIETQCQIIRKQYKRIFNRLGDHSDDIDYNEQVAIVCNAIVENLKE